MLTLLTLVPLVENVFCFHVPTNFRRRILAFHDHSNSNPQGELLTPLRLEERADRKLKPCYTYRIKYPPLPLII